MKFLVRAALAAAILCSVLGTAGTTQAQTAPVTGCGRVAILIAGYNTSSSDVPGTFRDVIGVSMAGVAYAAPPIQFSYSYPATYTSSATYDALPSKAVLALHETIDAELARCPDGQFDLIGHSLGGAVIARYLSLYGAAAEGLHILHAITLDSPVNGTSHTRIVAAAALLGQSRLAGSPTGMFLASEWRSGTARSDNVALVHRLAAHTIVRTLESADDWIVPRTDAEIPGASVEFRLGRNYLACTRGVDSVPSCLGHDRILHDHRSLTAIHAALTSTISS